MADLKRCDICQTIWTPEDHQNVWQDRGVDKMRGSVSLNAPSYYHHNATWNEDLALSYEACQKCVRAIKAFVDTLKP